MQLDVEVSSDGNLRGMPVWVRYRDGYLLTTGKHAEELKAEAEKKKPMTGWPRRWGGRAA